MLQFLFELFLSPNGDPKMQRNHQILRSLTIIALCVSVGAAYGLAPKFSGFAYASAVKDIKVDLLEGRVFDSRVRWCTATTAESRQFYAQKVSELLFKYRDTTGSTYQLPSCLELR